MTWTDASIVTFALVALVAITLLVAYSLLTLVILVARLVTSDDYEVYIPTEYEKPYRSRR